MRRSPHYSKSGTAKALMTIDCLNIACICRGGCLCPPSLHLSRETGSGLSSTCLLILPFIYDDRDNIPEENATPPVFFNFSLPPSLLFFPPMLLFLYIYSVRIYCKNFIKCLFFMRLHEKPEQGCRITLILPGLYYCLPLTC